MVSKKRHDKKNLRNEIRLWNESKKSVKKYSSSHGKGYLIVKIDLVKPLDIESIDDQYIYKTIGNTV